MRNLSFTTRDPDAVGTVTERDGALEFAWQSVGIAGFEIPISEIRTMTFERGILRHRVLIRFRDGENLRRFPIVDDDAAALTIARRDRDEAEALVRDVSFSLMDAQLDDMLDITDI